MNTLAASQVPSSGNRQNRIISAFLTTCWLTTFLCLGCVDINGGASELTWSLRTFEGKSCNEGESCDCASTNIDKVRLCWSAVDDPGENCQPGQFRDFDCEEEKGVTLFEIPEGRTKFNIDLVCRGGQTAPTGTYQGPPEIVRTVREGEVVNLDALLIVVRDPLTCGTNCTCSR
jgi:hypothetical protein